MIHTICHNHYHFYHFFCVSSAKERLIATIGIVIRCYVFKSCCFSQISYYNLLDLSLLLGESYEGCL